MISFNRFVPLEQFLMTVFGQSHSQFSLVLKLWIPSKQCVANKSDQVIKSNKMVKGCKSMSVNFGFQNAGKINF